MTRTRLIESGHYYYLTRGLTRGHGATPAGPGQPDVVLCRPVADFPDGRPPAGAAIGTCRTCRTPIAYDPKGPHQDAPRECMRCAGFEPAPLAPP